MYTERPPTPKQPFDLARVLASAVVASAVLASPAESVDALSVAHSLCLPTGRPNEFLDKLYRRQRRVFLSLLIAGGVLLACMIGLSIYMRNIPWQAPGRMALVVAAMVCLVLAIVCFVLAAMGTEGFYGSALRGQLDRLQGPDLAKPQFVKISYPPELISKERPVTADVGYVVCAPAQRRIVIEGVLLRHIIRAEDVLDFGQVQSTDLAAELLNKTGTHPDGIPRAFLSGLVQPLEDTGSHLIRLGYRIGDAARIDERTHLILDLEQDSIRADILRALGRQPLHRAIHRALTG